MLVTDPHFRRPGTPPAPRAVFADGYSPVDVTTIVVTYNSVNEVGDLLDSLRAETRDVRMRVVLVDNGSTDGTLAKVRGAHPDVICIPGGSNRGYAGGINLASAHVGRTRSILILNPDIVVSPGSVKTMLARLNSTRAGIVVPMLLQSDGSVYPSIRNEPSLSRALGDALCGGRFARRPGALSEMVFPPRHYARPHPIEWATGAALMVEADLARDLGSWDERYFLYSEETDYMRRARTRGATVWFEPAAVMVHAQGKSGASGELNSLSAVNRIRYIRKFHSPFYAALFRALAVFAEVIRLAKPEHRRALWMVTNESAWSSLPSAEPSRSDSLAALASVPLSPTGDHRSRRQESLGAPRSGQAG